jgi:branched-chain amino acid transport system substrate-binding protein
MLSNTAVTQGYNPKVFHVGVGTAFARYGAVMKEKAEGVMGIGGWDPKAPGAEDYLKRLVALTNQPGDAWAAPVTYASLQVLGAGDRERSVSTARSCSMRSRTAVRIRPLSVRSI